MPLQSLERYLAEAKIERRNRLSSGSVLNKEVLELSGGVRALLKPVRAKAAMAAARYESAAWHVASILEWADLVPATVLREHPNNEHPSSVQVWVPEVAHQDLSRCDDETISRAAAFDALVWIQDREEPNFLVLSSGGASKQHVVLIDHGQAFGVGSSMRSVLVNEFVRRQLELPDPVRDRVSKAVPFFGQSGALAGLLSDEKLNAISERADRIVQQPNLVWAASPPSDGSSDVESFPP